MHSGRGRCQSHAAVFASVTKDQHLSHGSGSLKNWVDFIWESDFIVFLLVAQRLDPKADVPPRHGPSGWRVQAELRVGVRVKFRGWRSDEGQGYGQVRVTVRSKYPTPLGQHLSGHCLPLRPVKKMWLYDVQHSHWHETLFCNYATILTIVSVTIQHKC